MKMNKLEKGSAKQVIVYARARIYYILCKKHPIIADMVVIDSEFKSTHCENCCAECKYDIRGCEKREEDMHRLIYYFRKKGGITTPNPLKKEHKELGARDKLRDINKLVAELLGYAHNIESEELVREIMRLSD